MQTKYSLRLVCDPYERVSLEVRSAGAESARNQPVGVNAVPGARGQTAE